MSEVLGLGLLFGVPLCMLVLFGYLSSAIWKRMKEDRISKGWGYTLLTVCLIPIVFCVFIIVVLIGFFTGAIPLM